MKIHMLIEPVVFAIFVFFVVLQGYTSHKSFTNINNHAQQLDKTRTAFYYISNKIHQNDCEDKISIKDDVLFIEGEYKTCIFYDNGALYEAEIKKEMEFDKKYGEKLFDLNEFEMSLSDKGILYFYIMDKYEREQTMIFKLRSVE